MADLYNNVRGRAIGNHLLDQVKFSPYPRLAEDMITNQEIFDAVATYMKTGDYAVRGDYAAYVNRRF